VALPAAGSVGGGVGAGAGSGLAGGSGGGLLPQAVTTATSRMLMWGLTARMGLLVWSVARQLDGSTMRGRVGDRRMRVALALALAFAIAACNSPRSSPQTMLLEPHAGTHDGQHDFDFEIGTWHTALRRLMHPLTGSTEWVTYDGTTTVRKVWDGRANLVE